MNIFEEVDKFFTSIPDYVAFNAIFITAIALFLFTIFCVILSTTHAYEAKLIKTIDMFNSYFIDNPNINEDNLVSFNNKMKSRKVPKLLRKQWQQFVLYREHNASYYMSFENCVATPLKNSTFKRDITTMNIISYILAFASVLLRLYDYETATDIGQLLSQTMLTPAIILLLNYIVTIFLDLRHNAIVSDLNQNYQYFEVNIDKATRTLPEYVDYEILFEQSEIKKGIPILYAYLQKRAEEEQRELERARLRNVEHEKFNFDEAGVESSLVLERAMQEAENYMAERKKHMQDIEQINNDMTQEELNFREITKEYRRQIQVSKESFDNYKALLAEASSSIETNYLNKQQQQELDRQRNLERDYDIASENHKKLIEGYQTEIATIEGFIAEARKTLERAMMSEFETYRNKVYDEAYKAVEEREKDKTEGFKKKIIGLEETISAKQTELDSLYDQNQSLIDQIEQEEDQDSTNFNEYTNDYQEEIAEPQEVEHEYQEEAFEPEQTEEEFTGNEDDFFDFEDDYSDSEEPSDDDFDFDKPQEEESQGDSGFKFNYMDIVKKEQEESLAEEKTVEETPAEEELSSVVVDVVPVEEKPKKKAGRPKKTETTQKPKGKPGRPKKVVTEEKVETKKTRGRPKKAVEAKTEIKPEAKKRGRPKKTESTVKTEPKRRGRPRKIETETKVAPKRGRGRPKKVETGVNAEVKSEAKKRGRPKKEETKVKAEPKRRGRPRKAEQVVQNEVKTEAKKRGRPKKVVEVKTDANPETKKRGRPKKSESTVKTEPKRRGRPRKIENADEIKNIDEYLKEIDDQIAKENAKIERTKKALEKKTRITKKK
ncbi:MAG: hypothetical protein E7374_00400 [Clostridiales bacterium]|nr:hypothetical protein [Clostridiales bacterium]